MNKRNFFGTSLRHRREVFFNGGFTLIELLVTVGIIGILATLLTSNFATIRNGAEKVVCMGHLRSLYVGLGSYMNDNGTWPLSPQATADETTDVPQNVEDQFWIDTLKDYGIGENIWICPTAKRQLVTDGNSSSSNTPLLNYTPSMWEDPTLDPRRWPGHPWLMEHGGHGLMIRSDGGIMTIQAAMSQGSD